MTVFLDSDKVRRRFLSNHRKLFQEPAALTALSSAQWIMVVCVREIAFCDSMVYISAY